MIFFILGISLTLNFITFVGIALYFKFYKFKNKNYDTKNIFNDFFEENFTKEDFNE